MSEELEHKLKKIKPIIKIQKAFIEKEQLELVKIQQLKQMAQNKLHESQAKYLNSLDLLNKVRCSTNLNGLMTYENGTDKLKGEWFSYYESLRECQRLEKEKKAVLSDLQKNLKALETLTDNIKLEIKQWQQKKEQKNIDEFANRQFVNQMRGGKVN